MHGTVRETGTSGNSSATEPDNYVVDHIIILMWPTELCGLRQFSHDISVLFRFSAPHNFFTVPRS